MAQTPTIRINASPKKAVPVDLLGTTYLIKPPKSSLLLAISRHGSNANGDAEKIGRDLDTILKLMFGKNASAIQERLDSADDDLDIDHIFDAVEAITEETTGNPTS